MIRSMTGYGKAECRLNNKTVTFELKSLNGRQLDINFKLPANYREKESKFRDEIAGRFARGKIDLIMYIDYNGAVNIPEINSLVLGKYTEQLAFTCSEIGVENPDKFELMKLAMRMPEVLQNVKADPDEQEWTGIFECFNTAAEQLDIFRIKEGEAIARDIMYRADSIEECLQKIELFEGKRIEKIRSRLNQNLSEFFNSENIDRNRFEQEIIFYIEKLDITEEKVRLKSHLDYFRQTIEDETHAGKKLNFISQEMGREINTIGSKANDFDIQKLVVQMKDELEKIKEQSLNIL